jgi:hypothetical protein
VQGAKRKGEHKMIDNLSILLSHALIGLLFWFLLTRDDLDNESPPPMDSEPEGFSSHRIKLKTAKKAQEPGDA